MKDAMKTLSDAAAISVLVGMATFLILFVSEARILTECDNFGAANLNGVVVECSRREPLEGAKL